MELVFIISVAMLLIGLIIKVVSTNISSMDISVRFEIVSIVFTLFGALAFAIDALYYALVVL